MSLVAKLKGARDGSDALNGRHDEPRSIPERDYASVAPDQRRWSLRETETERQGVPEPEFDAVLGKRVGGCSKLLTRDFARQPRWSAFKRPKVNFRP